MTSPTNTKKETKMSMKPTDTSFIIETKEIVKEISKAEAQP